MTVAVNRLANGTIELTITISWSEIKTTYDHVVDEFVQETELPGFRKGKAPKNLVEEILDKSKVYEEVLKHIVPKAYTEAIKQENISPIVPPKIEVIAAQPDQDWQFKALTAEKPKVKLGNYQQAISDLRKTKTNKIWVPGEDKKGPDEEKTDKPAGLALQDIIKALLETSQITIPDLLTEDEVNRMLSRLIDQTQKLGLTIEQYLLAQGKTSESIRNEYREQAIKTLSLEFILEAIADQEKIEVTDQEIENLINQTKDDKEKEALKGQKYYLETILRQQKTLDKLANPIV